MVTRAAVGDRWALIVTDAEGEQLETAPRWDSSPDSLAYWVGLADGDLGQYVNPAEPVAVHDLPSAIAAAIGLALELEEGLPAALERVES